VVAFAKGTSLRPDLVIMGLSEGGRETDAGLRAHISSKGRHLPERVGPRQFLIPIGRALGGY